MKLMIAALTITFAAAAPAHAEDTVSIKLLAHESGLTVRKVQMILGNRTAFAEYPYTYQRSLEKFQKAIGKDNYNHLISGQPIKLRNGVEISATLVAEANKR